MNKLSEREREREREMKNTSVLGRDAVGEFGGEID
jgi:hypothetical protein